MLRATYAGICSVLVLACATGSGRSGDSELRFAPDSIPGVCAGGSVSLRAARDTVPRPSRLVPVQNGIFPRIPPAYLGPAPPRERIIASLVVDTAGRVMPGSVAILSGRDRRYASSVCEWLPQMRFSVADLGTAPIRIGLLFEFGPPQR